MMDDLDRLIKKQMKNPKFREEMEKTELEYQIARAMMKARLEKNAYYGGKAWAEAVSFINRYNICRLDDFEKVVGKLYDDVSI